MSQMQWTVLGGEGQHYRVGLYHGDESGHLMVQCNGSILIIDFQVLDTKAYHFLLGEELYQLQLLRKADRFVYSLAIDESGDTSGNRRRKREKRNLEWVQIVVLAISIIVLLFLFISRFAD